jgi:apolipoprotein N-acyltransferase
MRAFDHFAVGVAVHGILFWGIFESRGGAFWMIYLCLVWTFSIFHALFFLSFDWRLIRQSRLALVLVPSIVVLYEFLRHCAAQLYDGSGLTFGLVGQFLPQVVCCQFGSYGGIWGLTYALAFFVWLVVSMIDRYRCRKPKILFLVFLALLSTSVAVFVRIPSIVKETEETSVVTVPFLLSTLNRSEVSKFLSDSKRLTGDNSMMILGVETAIHGQLTSGDFKISRTEDELWRQLSQDHQCSVLVGAWMSMVGREDRINALVQFRDGKVVCIEPKRRLAPFVESQPLGTQCLISMGWIPKDSIRNATPPDLAEVLLQDFPKPQGVQAGVCYDIFFGSAYLEGLDKSDALLVCSLDESYDDSGIFQRLSMQHSRIRAIEARRSLVRCSLGGITAAFDPVGRQIEPFASNAGMHLYRVPVCHETSFYARTGDWIVWLSLFVVGSWAASRVYTRWFSRGISHAA